MGLFSKLFQSSASIEKQLEDQYVPIIQGMMGISAPQAKTQFRGMLKRAKEQSLKDGTANLPPNAGDILLDKESTHQKTRLMLAKKRREGVRDEDIRWWWNMHDLERMMLVEIDNMSRVALFTDARVENMKAEQAAAKVRKHFPMYGDPEDTPNASGEDRPLPYELKDRVNAYVERQTQSDLQEFKKEIKESSSFNALVRKEIKKGNI